MKKSSKSNIRNNFGKLHYKVHIWFANNRNVTVLPADRTDFYTHRTFDVGDELVIGNYIVDVQKIRYRQDIDVTILYVYIVHVMHTSDYIMLPEDIFKDMVKKYWVSGKHEDSARIIYNILKDKGVLYIDDFDILKTLIINYAKTVL